MNSPTMKDALESLQYLTPDEAAELDVLLAGVPEPITIIWQVVRPDGSTEGYIKGIGENAVELAPDV